MSSDESSDDNTRLVEENSSESESEINQQVEITKLINDKKKEKLEKVKKAKSIKSYKTNDANIIVERKIKKKKPRKVIIIDSSSDEEEPIEIIHKKKKRGRPKDKKIVKYVDKDDNEVEDKLQSSKTIIDTSHTDTLTEKDLRMLKLQERLSELEAISGKKIRGTKKLVPDKRQTKPRTEKQIQATERLVMANKVRRDDIRQKKLSENTKASVKQVIQELSTKQVEKKAVEAPPPKPAYNPMNDPDL